ncbi:MAG: ATP-binding protein [Trebonia sp.]
MPATAAARTGRAQPCPDPPRPAPARPPRAFLDLGAVLTSPRCARAWTREILREWQLAGLTDDAEAIIAELVANAVHASGGLAQPVIRLALALNRGELAILVSDDNPDLPQAQHPAEDDESGRGLMMVETLSDRYGWYPLEGSGPGKVVWAILPAEPGATGAPAVPQDDGLQGAGPPAVDDAARPDSQAPRFGSPHVLPPARLPGSSSTGLVAGCHFRGLIRVPGCRYRPDSSPGCPAVRRGWLGHLKESAR